MKIRIFLAFALLTFFTGCKKKTDIDSNGVPTKLLIGCYAGDNPGRTKIALEPFRIYLQEKLGMEVEYIFATDYAAVIQAMRSKKIHMADLTPFAYVIATQKPGLIPLVTFGEYGRPALYHSIIFTNPQSGLKSMEDVKARSKDLTFCFADPASTSGHLIPSAFLSSIGLDPDTSFKETMFAGNHAASILSIKSGKVDVGCSNDELAFRVLIRDGVMKESDLVILWTSPPIINNAITIRDDLNKDFIDKIRNIYLNVARDNYSVFSQDAKRYYPDPSNMNYLEVQDSMYDGLRKIASGIKDLKL